MPYRFPVRAAALALAAFVTACQPRPDAGSWPENGRDLGKTFHSSLDQINRETVGRLGFAWEFKPGTDRGMESTPLVVEGVMYVAGVAGRVHALDAQTGRPLWQFEPPLDLKNSRAACCDLVNRGLAVKDGRVYVGAFDGILYALDARDGKLIWKTDTIVDRKLSYSVTGAPQIAGNVVVIGNGGAEYDSRGYVSAYSLTDGALKWRFYTVPGDPSKPQESAALERAVKTWQGRWWERGGGGNAWDAITYDPQTGLVYFGTANGAPTSLTHRSPGGGDNLFVASILAVKADSGEYVWHYQQTPGERWDYDATTHLVMARIKVQGADRDVLMQASKNGFFYVLDRRSGELLSADPFVPTTWAHSIDLKSGRPVEDPAADYRQGSTAVLRPSTIGAHNFNPLSFSARTGLVYIPSVDVGMTLKEPATLAPHLPQRFETGLQMALAPGGSASLKAWDPVARRVVWEMPGSSFMDHGGVLSTGGGLVVQGGVDGILRVFNDENGALLKSIDVGTAMIAAPMTYRMKGVQYLAITAGSGGGAWSLWLPGNVAALRGNANRVLVFKLDGGTTPVPPLLPPVPPPPPMPDAIGTAADIKAGEGLFAVNCSHCHTNLPRAPLPDLRRSVIVHDAPAFRAVVKDGRLQARGMPRWDDLLDDTSMEQIRAYLIDLARKSGKG